MKAHADPEASRNPPEQDGNWNYFPTKHEQGRNCPYMKNDHEDCGVPLDSAVLVNIDGLVRHCDSAEKYSVIRLMLTAELS
jgi:hypothetical protein